MLKGKDLACIRGDRTLFSRLDFALGAGELLRVQGANGAGKTSLLRMVCGLMAPAYGEITWCGERIDRAREDYHAELAYFGHMPAIKEELSALENLDIACRLAGRPTSRAEACDALAHLGLSHCMELPAKVLSQGQRRRVALSRLMLAKAKVWVLDEPLTALDVAAAQLVQSLIGAHLRDGGMAMLTTHQPIVVEGVEPRLLELSA